MVDLHFRTANYLLRPLTMADISDEWGEWLTNPIAAGQLNAPCRKLSRRELEQYLQRFDNKSRILLGVFHRPSGRHIGIFTIMESTDGRHALLNIFIGAPGFASIGSPVEMRQIRTAVGDYIFFERGYLSAVASVVAGNRPMIAYLRLAGWELMKRSIASAVNGQGKVELLTFRLTREAYIRRDGATWTGRSAASGALPPSR